MRTILLMLTVLAAQAASATCPCLPCTTLSEQSGFTRTGRYAEVIALCGAFAKRYPKAVKCQASA